MMIVMLSVCGIVCIVLSCVMFPFICFMPLIISGCGMSQQWLCHVLELDALMSLASGITLMSSLSCHHQAACFCSCLDDSMSPCPCAALFLYQTYRVLSCMHVHVSHS